MDLVDLPANLPLGLLLQNTLKAYPCGSDHTPSPMASRAPQEAKAVWQMSPGRLTAVAVSVREGHSIAFLGDTKGTLHKVAKLMYHFEYLYVCVSFFTLLHTLYTLAQKKVFFLVFFLCTLWAFLSFRNYPYPYMSVILQKWSYTNILWH